MRLFTALWPPPEVVVALSADVAGLGLDEDPAWRPGPATRWHVTLAFHGEDEPGRRARELQERAAGAPAPTLRIAGTGEFPGVLWAGVEPACPSDADALAGLVALAGGVPDRFVAHLTLAHAARRRGRSAGPPPERPPVRSPDLPAGPWWTPSEVLLVASVGTRSGLVYETVHRVALGTS
ncbi:MAG: RNA 2',3'-cyclic phosphodiesterase [Pseudonocardia sp.]|nr:RNA 2',3'-cyclic phosphodiesterase [Pseudonocardia sp.]